MSQDVGLEDGFGGSLDVAAGDPLDELRDVDGGGAGLDTRGVVAVEAAIGFDVGLRVRQPGLEVGNAGFQAVCRQGHGEGVDHSGGSS
ncbi:hypothetical protein D3C72_2124080 [compost metagenome]